MPGQIEDTTQRTSQRTRIIFVLLIAVIAVLITSLVSTFWIYNAEISTLSNPYTGYPTADPHGYVIAPLNGPFNDWPLIASNTTHFLYDIYFVTPDEARNVYVNGSASSCNTYTEGSAPIREGINLVHCITPAFSEIQIVNDPLDLNCALNYSRLGATVYDSANVTGLTTFNVPVPSGANCFFVLVQSALTHAGQVNATVMYTWPGNGCPPVNSPTLPTLYATCVK